MPANKALVLAKHPLPGVPVPGSDLIIQTTETDLVPPPNGLVLKTHYLSYDPYQRGRMKPPNAATYTAGYALGSPLNNNAISTVLSSNSPAFKAGDVVIGDSLYQEFVKVTENQVSKYKLLDNPLGLDPKVFLGALGMSGLTAYSSFYEIGKPKKGDTIFISAASGAVGQIVGQLAKREGLKVLGSVGSDEKLDFIVKELGFDAGFNYKKESAEEGLGRVLREVRSQGLNIYYDNVGGEQLDVAISKMAVFGRVVCCGSVSQTSLKEGETYRLANIPLVVARRLTLRGFIVGDADMGPLYAEEHQRNLQQWIKEGSIKVKLSVTEGIDKAAEGLVGMLKGENFGKAVLSIAEL